MKRTIIICLCLIVICIVYACAFFQGIDREKVNQCAEDCTLSYVKNIDALNDVMDKKLLTEAGLRFSNCMIQCTDATDYVFEYISNAVNNRNVQLK